jgi:hypothetical protein
LAEAIRNKSDDLKRIGGYSVEADTLIEIAMAELAEKAKPVWRELDRHISLATLLPRAALLSVSSTFAPCSAKTRAVSAPIPDAPPVTIATLPTSLLPKPIRMN